MKRSRSRLMIGGMVVYSISSSGRRCGRCEYRDLCGGSRARAYAAFYDPLAEDPLCLYEPEGLTYPRPPASPQDDPIPLAPPSTL